MTVLVLSVILYCASFRFTRAVGKTIYDKFFGEDIWLALTNVLTYATVYTQKKELLTGRKCVLQTTSKGS